MTAIGLALLIVLGIANQRAVKLQAPRFWIWLTEQCLVVSLCITVVGLLLTVWRYFA